MYEVGTYNSEPVAAYGAWCAAAVRRARRRRRWRRRWRAARWRRPRSHFLNDRETNPGLAGVPTVTCYNIDRLRASAQTMPGHLIIFLRQKNPTRHKKALTLYTLSFRIIPVIVFEKNADTSFFLYEYQSQIFDKYLALPTLQMLTDERQTN